ncbi:glycoside hydrolase family 32 protein [Hymenobacter sp. M29]|uniref:beta-fructofuranosidase n=1 Tax=Hymenobacter mellowenesis TaxID=3063995 RepID=A0ABT9A943_9BACT|nr:glycoside hydrolase family 32 protein [Hymenobacter sp. M29]MDO7846358.1 glycoside hydrolase family 32 protein [Hymenobacter sp. M29]
MRHYRQLAGVLLAALSLAGCKKNDPATPPTPPTVNPGVELVCTPPAERNDYGIFPKVADGAGVGDVMPFFDAASGTQYLYYLKDVWSDVSNQRHPWYAFTTSDFRQYTEVAAGELLASSAGSCAQDRAIGTGSVIARNGTYYAFYTGNNPNADNCGRRKEGVMLATAPGPAQRFTKSTSFATLYVPTGQGFDENDNFRDPFVYQDDAGQYAMLVSARRNVAGTWRGVIVKLTSPDLLTWTYQSVLYDGGTSNYFMMECPQLFKIGSTYYLTYSDTGTRHFYYRKSAAPGGPWSAPAGNERVDGSGLYAARVLNNTATGKNYLIGWVNRLENNSDAGNWWWGGNLVTHQLNQLPNGDLTVSLVPALKTYLEAQTEPLQRVSRTASAARPDSSTYILTGPAAGPLANVLFKPLNLTRFKLSTTVSYSSAAKDFGFMLGACDGTNQFYSLRFVPSQNRFSFDRLNRSSLNAGTSAVADVPFPMQPNTDYTVDIVEENSVVVVYLNGVAALSVRIYKAPRTSWGIFADNSTATFKNLTVTKP